MRLVVRISMQDKRAPHLAWFPTFIDPPLGAATPAGPAADVLGVHRTYTGSVERGEPTSPCKPWDASPRSSTWMRGSCRRWGSRSFLGRAG